MEFFRHCPECGRRFHIKLEEKKMVHLERRTTQMPGASRGPRAGLGAGYAKPTFVSVGPPVTLDIEDFEYHYKCGHCGHEWTEHHREKHREH